MPIRTTIAAQAAGTVLELTPGILGSPAYGAAATGPDGRAYANYPTTFLTSATKPGGIVPFATKAFHVSHADRLWVGMCAGDHTNVTGERTKLSFFIIDFNNDTLYGGLALDAQLNPYYLNNQAAHQYGGLFYDSQTDRMYLKEHNGTKVWFADMTLPTHAGALKTPAALTVGDWGQEELPAGLSGSSRGPMEYFPERRSNQLYFPNEVGIWEKRINETAYTKRWGSAQGISSTALQPEGVLLHYSPKHRMMLFGSGNDGVNRWNKIYRLYADGTLLPGLDMPADIAGAFWCAADPITGNFIVVRGTGSEYLVYEYDPSANTWTNKTALATALPNLSAGSGFTFLTNGAVPVSVPELGAIIIIGQTKVWSLKVTANVRATASRVTGGIPVEQISNTPGKMGLFTMEAQSQISYAVVPALTDGTITWNNDTGGNIANEITGFGGVIASGGISQTRSPGQANTLPIKGLLGQNMIPRIVTVNPPPGHTGYLRFPWASASWWEPGYFTMPFDGVLRSNYTGYAVGGANLTTGVPFTQFGEKVFMRYTLRINGWSTLALKPFYTNRGSSSSGQTLSPVSCSANGTTITYSGPGTGFVSTDAGKLISFHACNTSSGFKRGTYTISSWISNTQVVLNQSPTILNTAGTAAAVVIMDSTSANMNGIKFDILYEPPPFGATGFNLTVSNTGGANTKYNRYLHNGNAGNLGNGDQALGPPGDAAQTVKNLVENNWMQFLVAVRMHRVVDDNTTDVLNTWEVWQLNYGEASPTKIIDCWNTRCRTNLWNFEFGNFLTNMFPGQSHAEILLDVSDVIFSTSPIPMGFAVEGAAPPPPTNQAPVVNAGSNQTITLPAGATLSGSVADDGLPSPSALVITWTKQSGPGTVTFGNANIASTTAAFSVDGTYVLRLTADDGDLSSFDELTIVVEPVDANQAPVVNAGPDQTIQLPSTASLNGTVSDDGLPEPASLTTLWTKQSGPGTVGFGNAALVDTTASFSIAGAYVLRLTADDGDLTSFDEVSITVNAIPPPSTPDSRLTPRFWRST